jgi:hypothetical protein
MKYTKSELTDMIQRSIDEGRNLTNWENSFLESLSDQLTRTGSLSEKQEEILERIYCDKVP